MTRLLQDWSSGDTTQQDLLFERIYPEIRALAQVRWLHAAAELQTTEVVNEAYLRLVDQRRTNWQSRSHFFAVAATAVRRVVADEARRRGRRKRGPEILHVSLSSLELAAPQPQIDVLELERALISLADFRATAARIVELRFFAGLSIEDTADMLGLGRTTVVRQWRFARAWLSRRLAEVAV